jgi:hypothetical protein
MGTLYAILIILILFVFIGIYKKIEQHKEIKRIRKLKIDISNEISYVNRPNTNPQHKASQNRTVTKLPPKCNCDGCHRQEKCEYGHMIFDEYSDDRLTLFDKFTLAFEFSDEYKLPSSDRTIVTDTQALHSVNKLYGIEKSILDDTLQYLLNVKKWYYEFSKCGKSYYDFMHLENEIITVKEAIKKYYW